MQFVRANGLNFCLERRGSGDPVLFLGGTGWDLRDRPNPLDGPLAKHFEVILFDQRGMGQSDKPDIEYSMADYAEDALGILDALGLASAHVVGFSFGGMVAQELAIRHPDRVRRLVLAGATSGGAGGSSYPIHEFLDLDPETRARRGLEVMDLAFTPEWQAANPTEAARLIRERMILAARRADDMALETGKRRQLAARAQHDCFERLHRIQAPTLVIAGERDGQAPRELVARLASAIADARMIVVPGAHHTMLGGSPNAYEAMIEFFNATD
ncbi:MAG: alpha/beta fold hydrolase [Azoarcus sp.]|nr:alpha/beta fold hydrolase [Azoarcus sp.]